MLKVSVPVKPEIKVGGCTTGLKATKNVNTVDDADVDAELARMQNRNARIVTREGAGRKR